MKALSAKRSFNELSNSTDIHTKEDILI